MDVTAIVLAGGKGSRMNNRDKAWVEHKDKPLLAHVIERIAPQVDDIIISRNHIDLRDKTLPYRCVSDGNLNFNGPLAGIASCLEHVTTAVTLVVPCDTPSLPTNLVSAFQEFLITGDLVIAHDGNREQPLIMMAKTDTLANIQAYLNSGKRSVRGWLQTTPYQVARFTGAPTAFENINDESQLK
jgi:molybdopterin-guanine dinucleotide biosynthesis protein A